MRYNQIDKIILFGGSPLLVATVKWLKTTSLAMSIYTSPRHAVEILDETGVTLKNALDDLNATYLITDDINYESMLLNEITPYTLGLGMGQAWRFSKKIIDLFRGQLLDFMGIPLPRYRGGAHYTWMILRNDRQGACNLQVINEKTIQGVFDSGEIVKKSAYKFPVNARLPIDYFNAAVNHEVNFIQEFLQEVADQKEFQLEVINESQSLYLPRLNTLHQAWIDWSWTGEEIERFICAFDEPYMGASTNIGTVRVHLKNATLDKAELPFHPFQSGIITRITPEEGVVIATRTGHLMVKSIISHEHENIDSYLRVGERLFTPNKTLEESLKYRAEYGATATEAE